MTDSINDHDLLVSIANDVKRVVKAIDGNGQPGLIQEVAVLKQDMRERQHEAEALRQAVPSKTRNTAVSGGVITAVMISAFTALREVFFK
jgi:hypothetical protein